MDFSKFSKAVADQFDKMAKGDLYKVEVDSDLLYQTYLDSFPEGTNNIYRERTSHDCSCCRNFIKNLGKVVTITDNLEVVSVWDVACGEYPYDIVAKKMSEFVKKQTITTPFASKERKYGTEFTLELREDSSTHRWDHFVGNVPHKHLMDDPTAFLGTKRSEYQVFYRGLTELKLDAIYEVEDLINSKSLYRGEEHLRTLQAFKEVKQKFDLIKDSDKQRLFAWKHLGNITARFRNTVIGTLVTDLSNEVPLEEAVRMFESKVAPANYKRPKALITPRMVEEAMKTVKELDIEDSLTRRFATFSDVSVEDVLFVDNSVKRILIGGLEDSLLKEAATKPVKVKNTQEVTIDEFINTVIPKANEVEVLVKNTHTPRFMSLTAPVNKDAKGLFKWGNNFAWSYDGNVTDSSIKERVKAKGGNTDALLRCSLAWFNTDDLDISVRQPNMSLVDFRDKKGILDVDMNVTRPTRDAVENLSWTSRNLQDGTYTIIVDNYTKRESIDVGCELEVEFGGIVKKYKYPKVLGRKVPLLELVVRNQQLYSVKTLSKDLTTEETPIEKWGIKTENFVPVSSVILSPNHWSQSKATGNKHWFFILKGCKNPEKVRGIYNEFLTSDLEKHRKVFEIIGDKTKCEVAEEQMSGIGFSSTQSDKLTVKVKTDDKQQMYTINF